MQGKCCFFLGDPLVSAEILPALEETVERHITEYGVKKFIVCNNDGFNALAAKVLVAARERHPEILLTLMCCHSIDSKPIIPYSQFNGISYPQVIRDVPPELAFVSVGYCTIRYVDFLITYMRRPTKDLTQLLSYAVCQGKRITHL